MVNVGVFQCPRCEKVCVYRMTRVEDGETRKALASIHLQTHRLEESKHGIFRVMMAERFEQVELSETTSLSLGEWKEASKLPSALREGVRSVSISLSRQ